MNEFTFLQKDCSSFSDVVMKVIYVYYYILIRVIRCKYYFSASKSFHPLPKISRELFFIFNPLKPQSVKLEAKTESMAVLFTYFRLHIHTYVRRCTHQFVGLLFSFPFHLE